MSKTKKEKLECFRNVTKRDIKDAHKNKQQRVRK